MFLAEKLQQVRRICSATTDEVDGLGVGRAKFDLLATVIEAIAVFLRYELIDLGNGDPTAKLLGSSDVDEERLVGRAGKSAEEVVEVVLARRTTADDLVWC